MLAIFFPLIDTEKIALKHAPDIIPSFGNERILFVDDEAILVELADSMLKSLGYHVTSRTSSIEALQAFRARPYDFDLVITDMTMPNMRGDNLAIELLKIRPDIPIIICTGFSEMISEEKAKNLGVRRLIMKPASQAELSKALRDIFDKASDNTSTYCKQLTFTEAALANFIQK